MFNIFQYFRASHSSDQNETIRQLDELHRLEEIELVKRKAELHKTSKEFEQTVREFLDDRDYITGKKND